MKIFEIMFLSGYRKSFITFCIITTCVLASGCKKWLQLDPPVSSINGENVYKEDRTAISVVTTIYEGFSQYFTGNMVENISFLSGLSSDELMLYSGVTDITYSLHFRNGLISDASTSIGGKIWTRLYNTIFVCNSAIEGLSASSSLSSNVKKQLLGECYFIRSFCYFYLVNLYGDCPLILQTDPHISVNIPRSKTDLVYDQIILDLINAKSLLNNNYLNENLSVYSSDVQRLRPNLWAASALLARTYLYKKDYSSAEAEASNVIKETGMYNLVGINDVFLKNSRETIWQLQPIKSGRNTEDAFSLIIPTTGMTDINTSGRAGNPFYLSTSLISSFEPNDLRRVDGNWVNKRTIGTTNFNYAYKYKATTGSVTEYSMVLRLAEQYLIRAEARAWLGNLTGPNSASSDLNLIRVRAGLLPTVLTSSRDLLLDAILKERRVELFTEWGHRWLDIKRLGKVDEVMGIAAIEKGNIWKSYQQWYPLPFIDIQNSSILIQNNGY